MTGSTLSVASWKPLFGARPDRNGFVFHVWAPMTRQVELVLETQKRTILMARDGEGFTTFVEGAKAGDRYRYRVDGKGPYPDPAARWQPDGVHGPSALVDSRSFKWTDDSWKGVAKEHLVIYELHLGTFTPEGTFEAAAQKLPLLKTLGVTAVELLPVADFPGGRNWGYDGVDLFAPARCYGSPDQLRAFVNEAHRVGLAVLQDVVYNHLGPDGNYTGAFSPFYFTDRHKSPWGQGVNFDGEHSSAVRAFFIDNALHWIHEYHMDGLRLDATHAMVDDSPKHFVAELAARVHDSRGEIPTYVIAEDHRNMIEMIRPAPKGGWGLDGVWADDFHHQLRRHLTGDHEGYFASFSGTIEDLAKTLERGWSKGTDPSEASYDPFVICLQNHDQVGNRAAGDRLHHAMDAPTYRAVSTLLLTAPEMPLLFMGQEWAASTPFLFFTDHAAELGSLVTQGRREEFKCFSAFTDPARCQEIPDPQAASSYIKSQLKWEERDQPDHQRVLALYQALLALRQQEPVLHHTARGHCRVISSGPEGLVMHRVQGEDQFLVICHLKGSGVVSLQPLPRVSTSSRWDRLLSTEDEQFASDPKPIQLSGDGHVRFERPGAILLKATGLGSHGS